MGFRFYTICYYKFIYTKIFRHTCNQKKNIYLDTLRERGSERDCQIYIFSLYVSLSLNKFQRGGGLFSLVSLFLSLSAVSRRFDSIAVFLQRFSGIHPSSSFFRFVRSFNLCLLAEYNVPDFQGMIFIIDLIFALMILSERKAEPKKNNISIFLSWVSNNEFMGLFNFQLGSQHIEILPFVIEF